MTVLDSTTIHDAVKWAWDNGLLLAQNRARVRVYEHVTEDGFVTPFGACLSEADRTELRGAMLHRLPLVNIMRRRPDLVQVPVKRSLAYLTQLEYIHSEWFSTFGADQRSLFTSTLGDGNPMKVVRGNDRHPVL
jgi:hypothetical protein